jgi:hypothetical protein
MGLFSRMLQAIPLHHNVRGWFAMKHVKVVLGYRGLLFNSAGTEWQISEVRPAVVQNYF